MKASLNLDMAKKHQEIESFGVSGAWWAQVVGGWEHMDDLSGMPVRERISQLLFDKSKGIGIDAYRYNLGGGSKLSGKGSFSEPARAAESFDISDTEYDWSRDKAAVFMLRDAVARGCNEVVFFVNSPPERWTVNGKSQLDKAGYTNLKEENYPIFARYCMDVSEHFVDEGIPIKYLSPVNEPLWVWTGKNGQEGCHYKPWSVKKVMRMFAEELEKRPKLKDVKLSGAENGDIRWFNKSYTRAMLSDEVVRRNIDSVDTHSYFLQPVKLPIINDRLGYLKRYKKWMDRHYPGVALKTTEWTHMQGGRDYGIDSALEQAKVMYEDISLLDAASWQHWIAVSEVDYCDGLIYINMDEKTFELTKRYFAFGNFSKFITRGFRRVGINSGNEQLAALAFQKGDEINLILINRSFDYCDATLDTKGLKTHEEADMFTTSDTDSLEKYTINANSFKLQPRSINTILLIKN